MKNEDVPMLLCYEKSSQFCHRHILAEYLNIFLNLEVQDIEIDEKQNN